MKIPKTSFSGIFPAFLAGKKVFFENRAPSYFRYCHFASVCKISWKNTAREIQEIPFFRRKSAVPAIFRQSRLQKSVLLTLESCLMVGIVITNVFVWKNKEILGKSPMKICKNGDFRHILGIINTHLCAKNQKKLMMKSWKNAKKRFFRHISGIFGRNNTFFEHQARSHFRHWHFASVRQIS